MDPKQLKNAIKEGGKKGVELAGNADLGGPKYFVTRMESACGDMELLQVCMDAANKEIDPSEEEQKGGSGGVGKLIWSECETHISCISYVHADKTSEVNAKEWMVATLKDVGGGEIIKESDTLCQAVVKADGAKDRYILKDKDTIQSRGVEFLRGKKDKDGNLLFPETVDDDDWVPDDDCGVEW